MSYDRRTQVPLITFRQASTGVLRRMFREVRQMGARSIIDLDIILHEVKAEFSFPIPETSTCNQFSSTVAGAFQNCFDFLEKLLIDD